MEPGFRAYPALSVQGLWGKDGYLLVSTKTLRPVLEDSGSKTIPVLFCFGFGNQRPQIWSTC